MATFNSNQSYCNNLYICTYVVDPNHFYICSKSGIKSGMIKNVENKLEKFMLQNRNVFRGEDKPNLEDIVAYCHKETKFIRCRVLDVKEVSNSPCILLFAIDYGFPFHVFNTFDIYRIPEVFSCLPSPIMKVGLDILPAVKGFNYSILKTTTQNHHEWTQDALERFKKYLQRSIIVNFEPTLPIQHKGTTFGSMIVITQTGKTEITGEKMVDKEVAVFSMNQADFWEKYRKTASANVDMWDANVKYENAGIYELPSFDRYFYEAAKELKSRRKSAFKKEWTTHEKQTAKKVLSWLYRNEEHEAAVPSDDDFNEEEELYELYYELDEDIKKSKETPKNDEVVDLCEDKNLFKYEITTARLSAVAPRVTRKKAWTDSFTFMPEGYQIATYTQNQPRFVREAQEEGFEEREVTKDVIKVCAKYDDELEWPDD